MSEDQSPRRFRWEQCYEANGSVRWALCDTASDTRAEKLGLSGMVTCGYMVMHHALPNGMDGRPVPEQDFPKLIVELLNAHFAPKEEHLCEFSRAMDGTCLVCGRNLEDQA